MDRPASTESEVSPFLTWLGVLDGDEGHEQDASDAFTSLVDQLTLRPFTPAESVRRPDSRLPRIRYAFRGRLQGLPPADRAYADVKAVDRIVDDLQRVSRTLGERMAKCELQKPGPCSPWQPRIRRFRGIDAESAGQRYHQQLRDAAGKLSCGEALDLEKARGLFKEVAGLKSRSRYTAAGLERGALGQLGPLGEDELVSLLDAGGGALGYISRAQGREVLRPSADASAVTARCEVVETKVPAPAFGQPPPWRARAQHARMSHRQQLKEELRRDGAPPSITALNDNVTLAQVSKAVLHGDVAGLKALVESNSLWRGPNPSMIAPDLQKALGTQSTRFPLLFVAAFVGELQVWNILTSLLAQQDSLLPHLVEDVEGWFLPIILSMAPPAHIRTKDSEALLRSFFHLCSQPRAFPITSCLLLPSERWEGDAAAQPTHLLLERSAWRDLVRLLVAEGGFPQNEVPARMALVGRLLAEEGCMKDFLLACARGGDAVQPGSQAMAGLYLGVLKNSLSQMQCLTGLQALLEHGLVATGPLTPSAEQWPLHAAARHNCVPVLKVLLVARAEPFQRNARGATALELATASRSWSAAAVLRRAPRSLEAVHVKRVAQALARHLQELHAGAVEKDVAEALWKHMESLAEAGDVETPQEVAAVPGTESVTQDLLLGLLSTMQDFLGSAVEDPAAASEAAVSLALRRHVETAAVPAATAANSHVAAALARMALAMPLTERPEEREESPGDGARTDGAAQPDGDTEVVANLLARMVLAASPEPRTDMDSDGMRHEDVSSGHSDAGNSEVIASLLARMVLAASPEPRTDMDSEGIGGQDVSSGRSDAGNSEVIASLLARMVLAASPEPRTEMDSEGIRHEDVSSGHSDAGNSEVIASLLARMVLAASPEPRTDMDSEGIGHKDVSSGRPDAGNTEVVANVLARMVLAAPESNELENAHREEVSSRRSDAGEAEIVPRALAQMVAGAPEDAL